MEPSRPRALLGPLGMAVVTVAAAVVVATVDPNQPGHYPSGPRSARPRALLGRDSSIGPSMRRRPRRGTGQLLKLWVDVDAMTPAATRPMYATMTTTPRMVPTRAHVLAFLEAS